MEATSPVNTGFPFKKVLLAGIIVGSLDITSACTDAWLTSHSTPAKILTGIAAAATGSSTTFSATGMILLGLLIHFFIAMSFTFFFYFIYPALKRILKNNILIGVLYGIFIWTSMRFIVLPVLSQIQFKAFNIMNAAKATLIIICAIGLPLSFIMRKIRA